MIAYPITISPTGGLSVSTDPVRDMILALLDCHYWERVMLTNFGTPIAVFDPTDGLSVGRLLSALQLSLEYWISPDCAVELDESTDPDAGTLVISISYPQSTVPITFDASQYLQAMDATRNA
jgi:hypothetical protein